MFKVQRKVCKGLEVYALTSSLPRSTGLAFTFTGVLPDGIGRVRGCCNVKFKWFQRSPDVKEAKLFNI